jgi:glycosyltransferase involved in cell wall biosynthesis
VSICIPCRNGEEVIGYTLANLLKNDFPHEKMEIIVGNHGSTDKTVEIVDQFQKEYPLIKIIDVPYLGPNRAFVRNRILDVAQGEIFICIDADIFVSRNFIQNHYDIHKNDKECLVAGYVYAKNSRTRSSVAVTSIDFSNINLSTPLLKESSDCKDSREVRGILIDQENIFDLTEKKDVWRYFWSANL